MPAAGKATAGIPLQTPADGPLLEEHHHGVSFGQAVRVWLRVAALSFGGPAGQIAVMHRIIVDEKRWIGEARFLHALSYCTLLPGPEAQQLAIYIGWLMHRTRGGIAAGALFVAPGLIALMALSYVYAGWGHVDAVAALFFGLKAAVLAVVLQAVIRIGSRALKNRVLLGIAAAAFVAIFFFAGTRIASRKSQDSPTSRFGLNRSASAVVIPALRRGFGRRLACTKAACEIESSS